MEPSQGKSNRGKNPCLVQANRVPSRPPLPRPARPQVAIAQGGNRVWGQSSAPPGASPAHTMVSESSLSRGHPFGTPHQAPLVDPMVSESIQSNLNQESFVNMNWPILNRRNYVVGGHNDIPIAIPVEGHASNLSSMVFRPPEIPITHRPRYVWSPVTGYKLYWQPALGLRQAQRRAPTGAPREGLAHAPTPTNSPIYGSEAIRSIPSVDKLAFGERLQIDDALMDSESNDGGSTTSSPTTHHTMDATNPWDSSKNTKDGK